jgi:hypothetical protein
MPANRKHTDAPLPYSSGRRLRVATSMALLAVGMLFVSTPGWLLTGSGDEVTKNAVVGLAGALIGFAVGGLVSELMDPTYDAVIEAFERHSDEDYAGGFRNAIKEAVESAVAEVTSSAVDFGPRARLFENLQLGRSRRQLRIQSISLSHKWQTTQVLEDLFNQHPQFTTRILLMHPYSPHAPLREADIGFEPDKIAQLVDETLHPLASLRNDPVIGDRLKVRGYFSSPYYGMICRDSNRCLVTLSREGRGGDQNFAMLLDASNPSTTAMVKDLMEGFDERWTHSYDLLDRLSIEPALEASSRPDGLFAVAVHSDHPLEESSIRATAASDNVLKVEAKGSNTYELVFDRQAGHDGVHVRIHRALSADRHAWLRTPIELLVARAAP